MKNKSAWILVALIVIIAAVFSCAHKHLAEIMAFAGNYYYQKNDITKAQVYFEKAFDLGLDNPKQREIYVNLLINSPLTIESQENLIKFLNNPQEDVAKLKAQYFLYDIKSEICKKYPNNYITNAVFNQKIVRWGKLPITYGYENSENVPDYYTEKIDNAFTELEKATEHQILFEKSENPNIIIKFAWNNPARGDDNKKYVVAYTSPVLNLTKLKNMIIVFYLKDPNGNYFSPNQIYNTALHEIVHAIGFIGHCNDKNNIMYLTKDSMSIINDTEEILSEADVNTIKLLYKIKPDITNVDEISSDYVPYLVLGEEKEVTDAKIKEAEVYIKKAPNLPSGYIDLAEGYVAAKKYPEAVMNLKKALQYADTEELRGMIYFNLSVTNFYMGQLETAKDYLIRSIQIKNTEEKHYLLGEIYSREGKTNEAIKEYSILMKQNPQNIEYVIALTNTYVIKRQYIKARNTLKQFFENNPNEKNNPRFAPYGILKFGL